MDAKLFREKYFIGNNSDLLFFKDSVSIALYYLQASIPLLRNKKTRRGVLQAVQSISHDVCLVTCAKRAKKMLWSRWFYNDKNIEIIIQQIQDFSNEFSCWPPKPMQIPIRKP